MVRIQESDEAAILEQGLRIRALHEIISRPDLTFDQQIDETLRLGCRILGTEVGKVGRQDPENNISEFLNTIVLSDLPARRGVQIPLDKTFCQVTFSSPETIAISHVDESEYKDHPAAAFLGMQSYIGCSINVHGKKFGTVNFSNKKPVAKPFTEEDKDLVNLIGSWISVMMERQLDAIELQKAKESAEKANYAKSVFLANMSHEIRTPLTAIIGFADAVLNNDQTDREREQALKIIYSSSNHLMTLINDVLDISKIESDEMDVEKTPVDIHQVTSDVRSIISGYASKKDLELSLDYDYPIPREIPTDPLRLKQILLNLCSNAVKFTHRGMVKIHTRYDRDQHVFSVSVADTGIGLTPEQKEKIFQPFVQADDSITRKYGGTGLGLSLSSRLAELLGGKLTVESAEGVGSKFTLTIQLDEEDTKQLVFVDSDEYRKIHDATRAENIPRLTGKVLVADDSELNQYLFEIYIKKTGASIDVVSNGELAVQYAKRIDYDLIIMDMMMPVLAGIDAAKIIREKDPDVPIVMLTANVKLESKKESKAAGCNDFLTKPINTGEFYSMLKKHLAKSE